MKKKWIAIILTVTMFSIFGANAYAVESEDVTDLISQAQVFEGVNPASTDILIEDFSRGTSVPTNQWNFSKGAYNFSAQFYVNVYTNYYFFPNASGKLKVTAAVVWPNNYTVQKKLTISLFKKGGGATPVGTVFGYTNLMSNGLYSSGASASKTFSGLDPNAYYYVGISKTTDSITAGLSGTVSQP